MAHSTPLLLFSKADAHKMGASASGCFELPSLCDHFVPIAEVCSHSTKLTFTQYPSVSLMINLTILVPDIVAAMRAGNNTRRCTVRDGDKLD